MSMKTIAQIVAPALLAIGLTPSAEAGRVTFTNVLEAGQEVNADGSPAPAALTSLASGTATLTVETNTASAEFGRYALSISVSDLIGQPLGVAGVGEFHIHDGDAGTNGPIVVTPLVEAGLFDPALDGAQALGTLSTDFGSRTILQDAVTGLFSYELTVDFLNAADVSGLANGGVFATAGSDLATNIESLFTDGLYYNLHTVAFASGEARGQILPVPATGLLILGGLTVFAAVGRRRAG